MVEMAIAAIWLVSQPKNPVSDRSFIIKHNRFFGFCILDCRHGLSQMGTYRLRLVEILNYVEQVANLLALRPENQGQSRFTTKLAICPTKTSPMSATA